MQVHGSADGMLRSRINRNNKFNLLLLLLLFLLFVRLSRTLFRGLCLPAQDVIQLYSTPSPFSRPLQSAIHITSTICRSHFTKILIFRLRVCVLPIYTLYSIFI